MAIRVAVVQTCAGPAPEANLGRALALVDQALDRGAELVALPEGFAEIPPLGSPPRLRLDGADPAADPALAPFLARARGGRALLLGGIPVDRPGASGPGPRHTNSALWLAEGRVAARYDKLHRFDATLPDGTIVAESTHVEAGDRAVLAAHGPLRVGLTICYDLRFPELYAALVAAGANALAIPAAFTVPTGRAHWEVLVRARAIETQCWVIAPAQWGEHAPGRASWGQSLIVDPWGQIAAECGPGEGLAIADLDLAAVEAVRRRMPVARHRRFGPGELPQRAAGEPSA